MVRFVWSFVGAVVATAYVLVPAEAWTATVAITFVALVGVGASRTEVV